MLLTWFPDAGFKEKLTKLSFLKLSETQKHPFVSKVCISFRTNTFVYARPKHARQRHTSNTKHNQSFIKYTQGNNNANNMNDKRTLRILSLQDRLLLMRETEILNEVKQHLQSVSMSILISQHSHISVSKCRRVSFTAVVDMSLTIMLK